MSHLLAPRSDGFPPDQRRGTLEMVAHKNSQMFGPWNLWFGCGHPANSGNLDGLGRLESWSPKNRKMSQPMTDFSVGSMSMFHLNSYRCTPWPSVVPPVALTFVRSVPMCGGRRKTSWSGKMELELTFVKPKIIKCILIKRKYPDKYIYIYFVYHLDFFIEGGHFLNMLV